MLALLQRVVEASVTIRDEKIARIGSGLLVLVCAVPADSDADVVKLADKLLRYRVFSDDTGKMNLNLLQIDGDILLVPQFTLAADTRHGMRPGFSGAAPPEQARRLFEVLVQTTRARHSKVQTGVFGAHMQVALVNDGPVTLWLES